jgi:hypothetical protein
VYAPCDALDRCAGFVCRAAAHSGDGADPLLAGKYALGQGALKGKDAKAAMVKLVHELGFADDDIGQACGVWLFAGAQAAPMLVTRHEPLFVKVRTSAI